jgi:AraC-like DNA-binding protein
MNAVSYEAKIHVLESFLLNRLKPEKMDVRLVKSVYNLFKAKDMFSKDILMKDTNITLRHLERRYKDEVGLSPRTLSRIFRFQRGVRLWQSGNISSLTQLALECGYYDQAHFNHDFKEFAGISPGAFALEQRQFADNFIMEG